MKSRLVARGYEETEDFRRDSPACLKETLRITLVIISTLRKKLRSLDIKTAFLNNDNLDRDIYVKPPKEAKTDKVWKRYVFLCLQEENNIRSTYYARYSSGNA